MRPRRSLFLLPPTRCHPAAGAIPAAAVLGPGRTSAVLLLALRCFRSAFLVVILAGVAIAISVGRFDQQTADDLTTVSGVLHAFATPLFVLAVGVVLRILLAPAAYLLALLVVAGHGDVVPTQDRRTWWTRWTDRLRVVGGYRALRWSTSVKQEAVDRLGAMGRLLAVLELSLQVLVGVAIVAVVLVTAYR